jgi:hypothetical protein
VVKAGWVAQQRPGLPDARKWSTTLALALIQALLGRRPVAQDSLETCPSDGQSAARAQRYASQLEQLVDEDGVVAAMVDEIEIPTKHGGCKAGEYIPGLATIAAHTPLRQDRGRDARAGGLGSHTVCSRMPGAVSSVSYSNEAVTSIPTATGRSRSATPSLPPADAPRRCTGH